MKVILSICLAALSINAALAQQIGSYGQKEFNSGKAIRVDSNSRVLRDADNRHVILHGVNVVYKVAPYEPEQDKFDPNESLSDEDIQNLKKWGLNMVRLGVMWESVETAEGVYNHTFLDEIDALITKLGENGIYTLVDGHQDVFARPTCGEGMPAFYANEVIKKSNLYCLDYWTDYTAVPFLNLIGVCKSIKDFGYRFDDNGNPLIEDCQSNPFFMYYTTREAIALFRALYYDDFGIQTKYVAAWKVVSDRLAPNKYVVGFDPLNEPFPSWRNLDDIKNIIIPEGAFDKHVLQPLYEKLFKEYQKSNPESAMWFEPAQLPDWIAYGFQGTQLIESIRPLGFSSPPGGKNGSNSHVLNDHAYCCQLGTDVCDKTGEPPVGYADKCRKWHEARFDQRTIDAGNLGIPLFISEFGSCMNTQECVTEIDQVASLSDQRLTSGWAYWQFKTYKDFTSTAFTSPEGFYEKNGTLQSLKVKHLARSYVKAAQGTISKMNFNSKTGEFVTTITLDTGVQAPSVVHLYQHGTDGHSDVWYGDGYDIKYTMDTNAQPDLKQSVQGNELHIMATNNAAHGANLTITVTPKLQQFEVKAVDVSAQTALI